MGNVLLIRVWMQCVCAIFPTLYIFKELSWALDLIFFIDYFTSGIKYIYFLRLIKAFF